MRYPPFAVQDMVPQQQAVADAIRSAGLGGLEAGYLALLHAPEIAGLALALGQFLRSGLRVPERLGVLAVLATAGRYGGSHVQPLLDLEEVRTTSLPQETIQALANGRQPSGLADDEAEIYDFVRELSTTGRLKAGTFTRVSDRLGKEACLELTVLCGFTTYQTWIRSITQEP